MDTSFLSAGRTTHLKIVSVALAFAIVVVLVGMHARNADVAAERAQAYSTVAGQPLTYAGGETTTIR